jgi:hypothetical protein
MHLYASSPSTTYPDIPRITYRKKKPQKLIPTLPKYLWNILF